MSEEQRSARQYKIRPIKAQVRELLGHPYPQRIPKGFVEQWIGISRDEFHRAKDADVAYMKNDFPLIDLGLSRTDCQRLLRERGFGSTPKSACQGCPHHGNQQWRTLRDTSPAEWADVVEFDAAIRAGHARANADGKPLLGTAFLHRSRVPLDQAPIEHVTAGEWAQRQTAIDTAAAGERLRELEDGATDGRSPWACRGNEHSRDDFGLTA